WQEYPVHADAGRQQGQRTEHNHRRRGRARGPGGHHRAGQQQVRRKRIAQRQPTPSGHGMKKEEPIDWSLEPPSKSQRKRDMTAVQDLGKDLTTLNRKQLEKLQLSDRVLAALAEFHRLPNSNEARRRHLQFIGKIMRDEPHEQIQQALEALRTPDHTEVRRAQLIEKWGERLLSGAEEDINAFLSDYPLAERQAIRQILRNYSREDDQAARVHRRRLLSYIKEYIA